MPPGDGTTQFGIRNQRGKALYSNGFSSCKGPEKACELISRQHSGKLLHAPTDLPGHIWRHHYHRLEEQRNVLTEEIIYEARQLYTSIMEITLEQNDRGHKYADLCASRNGRCVVGGSVLLEFVDSDYCIDPNASYPVIKDKYRKEDLREVRHKSSSLIMYFPSLPALHCTSFL